MSLEIRVERHGDADLFCPRMVCDHCGGLIEAAKDGHVLYRMWERNADGRLSADRGCTSSPLVFVHKLPCGRAWERAHAEYHWGWTPLPALVIQLGANIGIARQAHWKHAREQAASMGSH